MSMTVKQYSTQDRSYPAQIFNRMIFFNANSKGTRIGRRFQLQSIYESGNRCKNYAGLWVGSRQWDQESQTVIDRPMERHNFLGVELVRHKNFYGALRQEGFYDPLISVYIDGYAMYNYRQLGYDLGSWKRNEITEVIHAYFDILKDEDGVELLRRKPLHPDFIQTTTNKNNIGDILVTKYNNVEAINVI